MRATLQKSEILRGKINVREVFAKGEQLGGKLIRCFILRRTAGEHSSSSVAAGFVVRRTIVRAVDRNRVKRLLRESYRNNKALLVPPMKQPPGALSVVFMYAPRVPLPVTSLTYSAIEDEMRKLLTSIAQQYRS